MTTPLSQWDLYSPDDTISLNASATIGERLFARITSTETIVLASAGGPSDGVTLSGVTVGTGETVQVTICTEGHIRVVAGGTVTAGHDVMSDAAGKAVDATFGNLALGFAETGTTTAGDLVRIQLYERPHHIFGSGLGAEKSASLTLDGTAIHAGVVGLVSPESSDVIITRRILYVTTPSTGACKLDVGTTTVSITTASDNLLDGIDVNTAAGSFGLADGDGTNGKEDRVWTTGKWVTVKEISGDATGLVGKLILFYIIPA